MPIMPVVSLLLAVVANVALRNVIPLKESSSVAYVPVVPVPSMYVCVNVNPSISLNDCDLVGSTIKIISVGTAP